MTNGSSYSMIDPIKTLWSALSECPSPLCIETLGGSQHSGQLRSSNGVYCAPLSYDDTAELICLVKNLAALDFSNPKPQTGAFHLSGQSFEVHYCPQLD